MQAAQSANRESSHGVYYYLNNFKRVSRLEAEAEMMSVLQWPKLLQLQLPD